MKLNEYSDFMQKIKCNDEFRERMKKMLSSESDITCENEEKINAFIQAVKEADRRLL